MKTRKSSAIHEAYEAMEQLNRNLEKLKGSGIVSNAAINIINSGLAMVELEIMTAEDKAWKEAAENGEVIRIVV